MGDTSSGPGGVLYNSPDGPSGIFQSLDPAYQRQLLANQGAQLQLKQAQAFQDGLPTDARTGQTDYGAAGAKLLQLGDYGNAEKLQQLGFDMQGLNIASRYANAFGGGAPGSAASAPTGNDLQPAVGGAGTQNSRGGNPTAGANPDVVGYIRSAFTARGVNPNVALGVAGAEGLRGFDPNGNANPGDGGSSFGPFQLHMGGLAGGGNSVAGLGDDFAKATGLDPRDPSTWKQQVDFVADHVAKNGWGAFHGAKAAGIGNWAGIGDQPQGGGQPPAPGQAAAPTTAPGGGQAQPISFGGSGASPSPAAGGTAAPAGGGPISDGAYSMALRVVGAAQNADPRTMSLPQQQAITRAQEVVDQYQQEQATPPAAAGPASAGTSNGIPTTSADDAPPSNMHPFAPGGGGIKSPPIAPTSAHGQALAAGGQLPGGAMSISFGGAPGGATPTVAPAQPMPQPGRQPPPQAGALTGAATGGGAPPMAPGSQGGGLQQVSFSGGAPQGAPATPAAPGPAGMPPEVDAALKRLQNRQGSSADSALWGAYQRTAIQGAASPAGGQGGAPATGAQGLGTGNTPLMNDPGVAGILRSFQGGRYVNDPGAGLIAMRQAQLVLSGGGKYANPMAATFGKTADYLEQAITRSATLTNEQRNARDPAVMADIARKAQIEQDARLQGDTDQRRVTFAGQQAAATAAGSAAGAAPYKFVPTTPVPGGPTVYTSEADLAAGNGSGPAVKDQPAVFGQKQEALGKLDGELQSQFQQRQVAQERLDAMANLLETFQSGAGADTKAAAVAAVRAAGFNMPDSATANTAAVEQFTKNVTANVFSNAKDMGGRVLVSELDGLQKANANPNMQPASNAAIIAQQKGLLNWEDQHYQDYSSWRRANPYATDASAFETSWAKAHPVSAYVDAAKKDIAPLGAPIPSRGQLVDGQAYIVQGQKTRYDAGSGQFVPFSGTTAPKLPGQAPQRGEQGQGQGGTAPPVAGARQAPDGNWYTADPNRPGKYLMVSR